MKRSIHQLVEELDAATARARAVVDSLSPSELNRRPSADRWSVGECIQHLIDSNTAYLRPLERALTDGRSLPSDREREHDLGWLGSWFVKTLEPPPKRNFKAPRAFLPTKREVTSEVIDEFTSVQRLMIEMLERAAALDAAKIKLTSPASRLLRLSLIAAFATLASHERRHLWQAEKVAALVRSQ